MINQQILKNGGVEQAKIDDLVSAWAAYQRAKERPVHKLPHIVCTGIYNAGKSTLLNVLLDTEQFPTGDIPTTKKVEQAEFDGAVYVDTPGLNAVESDDQETENAYKEADVYLFVSNAQNGGIGEQEAGWLRGLKERHADETALQRRLVYVLSQCGNLEPETVEKVREKVRADLQSVLGMCPEQIYCVDAHTYRDGRAQNENLLVEASGIPTLRDSLKGKISESAKSLAEEHAKEIELRKKQLLRPMDSLRAALEQKLQKENAVVDEKIKKIESLWKELTEKLENYVSEGRDQFVSDFVCFSLPCSCRIESRSKSSVKNEMLSTLRDSMDIAWDKEVQRNLKGAKQYCQNGMNNIYFNTCENVNKLFERYILEFHNIGNQISRFTGISVKPEYPDYFQDSVEEMLSAKNSTHSASYYIDQYADKDISSYPESRRGFLGITMDVTIYSAVNCCSAAWKAEKDMKRDMQSNLRKVNAEIRKYWYRFACAMNSEIEKRKADLKKQLDSHCEQLKKGGSQSPAVEALNYIVKLKKEIGA